ncbi:MAG: flagellar basal body rod protein FlgB [Burkholderiaceae bacterium]
MNTLDSTLRFQEQALKLSGERQQMVASNIANADTPNYQAVDMNFAQALQRVQSNTPTVALATTAPGHLAPSAESTQIANAAVYSTAPQPSLDGNTVDMDQQRATFAEATVQYQAAFTFLNGQIKTIMSALQG